MNVVVNRTAKGAALHRLIALLCFVVLTDEVRADAASQSDAVDSKVPVRARDYIDDYALLNGLREGVVSLPSGVQYEVLQAGEGKQPLPGDTVSVHYRAMLANGVEFDNTYARDEPATLNLGEYLVPGLKEALLMMKEGDEWRVTIPAKMGFSGGRLLRKRDLIYEITLLSIVTATDTTDVQQETAEKPPEND